MDHHPENLIISKNAFLVVLDSRNATSYNNGPLHSDVFFELDDPLKVDTNTLQWKASVLTFSCPNSLYNINENNCTLVISVNNNTSYYNIPYGNYNVSSFINTLSAILPSTFNITINTITNIFTISNTISNFIINDSSTIHEVMGLMKNTNYSSFNKSLTLPFTCNFNGLQNLNIYLPSVSTKNVNSWDSSVSNLIQSIPIQCGSNQILYQKTNDYNFNIEVQILDSLNIQLRDDLNNLINLNNQHFNLTLVFYNLKNMDRFKNDTSLLSLVKYANYNSIGAYEA